MKWLKTQLHRIWNGLLEAENREESAWIIGSMAPLL